MSIRRVDATFDATFRVTTPMFCRGADATGAELRLPSFKGVLRYWWRALAWSEFGGDLGKIKKKEDDLFGSAECGQSRVSMRLKERQSSLRSTNTGHVLKVPGTNQPVGYGARYLGYGVMEAFASKPKGTNAGQLTRDCIDSGFDFAVRMRVSAGFDRSVALLERALIAAGCLGGLGAKSRRGYGSIAICSLIVDKQSRSMPSSMEDLRAAIAGLYRKCHASPGRSEHPEYTAFSEHARHVLLTSKKKESLDLLDLVGREIIRYRSWGRNGKILGDVKSEKNFRKDHDLMKKVGAGDQPNRHPERIAFGLPHNYGQRQQVGPSDKDLDRRASPLFIHIHEFVEGPVAVLSFLPARFLPDRCGIRVGGHNVQQLSEEQLYGPVTRFLDRLLNPGKRKEEFVDAVEVRR